MAETLNKIVFEGRWEDLLVHSEKLMGKRVRLVLLQDMAAQTLGQTLAQLARQWVEESEMLTPEPGPEIRGLRGELRRILTEKYRHQGLLF